MTVKQLVAVYDQARSQPIFTMLNLRRHLKEITDHNGCRVKFVLLGISRTGETNTTLSIGRCHLWKKENGRYDPSSANYFDDLFEERMERIENMVRHDEPLIDYEATTTTKTFYRRGMLETYMKEEDEDEEYIVDNDPRQEGYVHVRPLPSMPLVSLRRR